MPQWFTVLGLIWLTGWVLGLAVFVWVWRHQYHCEKRLPPLSEVCLAICVSFVSWPIGVSMFVWFFILKRGRYR
jgi:hypothetical protein